MNNNIKSHLTTLTFDFHYLLRTIINHSYNFKYIELDYEIHCSLQKEIDSFIFRNPFLLFCLLKQSSKSKAADFDSSSENSSESSRESHYFP